MQLSFSFLHRQIGSYPVASYISQLRPYLTGLRYPLSDVHLIVVDTYRSNLVLSNPLYIATVQLFKYLPSLFTYLCILSKFNKICGN